MNLAVRRALVAVVVIGIAVAAVRFVTRDDPVPVVVAEVDTGLVEATVANTRAGSVRACRRARLSPERGGQISRLEVREGDRVETGQLLLELWNEDLRASLELAEREAQASRAQAEDVCLMAAEAQREADRLQRLRQRQLASEQEVSRATTNAEAAAARCRAARETAQVSQARIAVARAALDQTVLVAPFSGTVAEVNGEIAEFVTPSPIGIPTPPAVDLIDTSCVYISAPIDEVDAPAIDAGMDARISVDAFPRESFAGIVQRVAPYVLEEEKQARTVDVEAVFLEPEEAARMLPGYTADIEIILEVRENVPRLPTQALLEGNRVLLFDPSSDRLVEREVETGITNWRYTEVVSGLVPGDRIVTSVDREGVEAGAHVRIASTHSIDPLLRENQATPD